MTGKAIEFECLYVCERLCGSKAGYVRNSRVSAQIQKHALAMQSAHAPIVEANLNGIRTDEAAVANDQLGAAFLVLVHVHADEAVNHPPLASPHFTHFNRCRSGATAEIAVMTN